MMMRIFSTIVVRARAFYKYLQGTLNRSTGNGDGTSESRLILIIVMAITAMVVLRNGWVGDDSYIILRTLENFSNGYGLRWNVAERVQTYTCPLWTLVLLPFYLVTNEGFFTTIVVSTVIALVTVYIMVFRLPKSPLTSVWVLVMLLMSRGFIDYSTSGLENGLGHLLIVGYFIFFLRTARADGTDRDFLRASLLLGLTTLNRMDTMLLLLPAHLYILFRGMSVRGAIRRALLTALGFVPFVVWLLFSLFYYGFLFPNTAYAKLNTGISSYLMTVQGLSYLRNCLDWDPLTALTIVTATVGGLVYRPRKHPVRLVLSIGILLSLVYVVRVGGDHMSVRFLTPAFVMSVLSLTTWTFDRPVAAKAVIALFFVIGLTGVAIPATTHSPERRRPLDSAGIVDHRNFASNWYSFFAPSVEAPMAAVGMAAEGNVYRRAGANVIVTGYIGVFGYNVGPEVFIIDDLALADPLVARLPFGYGAWRPAHFRRTVPAGYEEAAVDAGEIADPDLRVYYRHLKNIIRGDLFSLDRIVDIFKFNTGAYDAYLDRYLMRGYSIIDYEDISGFKKDAPKIPWNEKNNIVIGLAGLGIRIPISKLEAEEFGNIAYSVSLAGGEIYDLTLLSEGRVMKTDVVDLSDAPSGYLTDVERSFHAKIGDGTIDLIRFTPRGSFGKFSVGHFRIENGPQIVNISQVTKGGTGLIFTDRDIELDLKTVHHERIVNLSLLQDSVFRLEFLRADIVLWQGVAIRDPAFGNNTEEKQLNVPEATAEKGYDKIRLVPVAGTPQSRIGYVELH